MNHYLFDQIAELFNISLYIFSCDSKGRNRSFISVHGNSRIDNIFLCYVSDSLDFSQPDTVFQQKRRVILSRESSEVISRAVERLSLALPPLPPSSEGEEEAPDPLRPPLQRWPAPVEAERWLLVQNPDSFFRIFICRRGCQAVFLLAAHRLRHETDSCSYDPSIPLSERSCKINYTTRIFHPQDRIQDLFTSIGYTFSSQELSPNGFVCYDLESWQEIPDERMDAGRATQVISHHRLFCLGYSWALDGGQIESRVLYRVHFTSDYQMITQWITDLVRLAELNAELEMARKREVWTRLEADDAVLTREAPNGFHQRRLRKLMKKLRRRLSTLVLFGWNTSRFDLPLLIGCGLLAALKEHCPHINLLKRTSTSYMLIEASDAQHKFTLRFVDALLYSSPCTLAAFLESHRSEDDGERSVKEVIPYLSIQKAFNERGEDSGYMFQLDDFKDTLLQGENSLDFPYQQYVRAVREWGNEEAALKSLGLRQAPQTAQETYNQLREDWARRGLTTALQVLHSYQLADIEPLLRIILRRHSFIMAQAGVSSYLDHPSLSSQAFNEMLRSAVSGRNPMTFYPLGPFLTRLIRSQITGGASWVNIRKIQVGDAIPPQRIDPSREDGLTTDEMEKVVKIVTIDCNALYPKAMTLVYTGLPVLRLATNNFTGSLLARGRRHNFVYEWLAWCIATNEADVDDIESEFKNGESYVIIERSKYGAQIDLIWDETIGRYLEEEKQRTERERQEAVADINASPHSSEDEGGRLEDEGGRSEDESESQSEGGASSRLTELAELLEEALDEMEEEDAEEEIRPDLESSPEEEGSESPPMNPYHDGLADLHLMRRAAAARNNQSGRREPPPSPLPDIPQRADTDDPRPSGAKFRFSKNREILRFRVDGLGTVKSGRASRLVVFEFDTCGEYFMLPFTDRRK